MRTGWICVVAWLTVSGVGRAQAVGSPFAALSGIVLNDATGTPIRHAVVTLVTVDAPELEAVTFSESNGAFGFTAIPPGRYKLRVEMDGFLQAWFGASTSRRAPGILKLSAGDIRYGITFRLRPFGSISGVVLDADGDPVPGAQVRLLKAAWERLKPAYRDVSAATTDDAGRYRLSEVPAGQYIVMATRLFQPFVTQSEASAGQTPSQKMYAAEFYPDGRGPAEAAPLLLAAGEEREDIDFHLVARPVVPLHGRIVAPADVTAKSDVRISAFPIQLPIADQPFTTAGADRHNFEFEINDLIAGAYVIFASEGGSGRNYSAAERIELTPGGQDVTLHLEPAIDLAGRVDLEGGERPSRPLRVSLMPGGYPPGRESHEAVAQPDGSFVIPNVTPGIWDINVDPVPAGGYIKSMRLGDQDVLTEDMTIEPDTHAPLRIVVSARGAVVTGTVRVPKGVARSPRSSVLLAPYGKFANVLGFYAVVFADDAGHFEFKGVTPGRYKLYAFEEMESGAYEDPGFLKPFSSLGEAFDVQEGGHVDRQTQLIPAEDQAAARH